MNFSIRFLLVLTLLTTTLPKAMADSDDAAIEACNRTVMKKMFGQDDGSLGLCNNAAARANLNAVMDCGKEILANMANPDVGSAMFACVQAPKLQDKKERASFIGCAKDYVARAGYRFDPYLVQRCATNEVFFKERAQIGPCFKEADDIVRSLALGDDESGIDQFSDKACMNRQTRPFVAEIFKCATELQTQLSGYFPFQSLLSSCLQSDIRKQKTTYLNCMKSIQEKTIKLFGKIPKKYALPIFNQTFDANPLPCDTNEQRSKQLPQLAGCLDYFQNFIAQRPNWAPAATLFLGQCTGKNFWPNYKKAGECIARTEDAAKKNNEKFYFNDAIETCQGVSAVDSIGKSELEEKTAVSDDLGKTVPSAPLAPVRAKSSTGINTK